MKAFRAEYGRDPDFIGIGTNDLTQFTIALGRDVAYQENDPGIRDYLAGLYDESDFSVIKQIYDVVIQTKGSSTRLFLLGEAASHPVIGRLALALGITPSVAARKNTVVKRMVGEFERSYLH